MEEEMASLWSYQESIDELKIKIHHKALELEAVKVNANEEMNRNTESLKQLLHLLKLVCNERDEARNQIQKLLVKIMPSINNIMISDCFTIDQFHHHHHNNLFKPAKANSSFAESNSSPPVDSLFDSVTSPEFSNINSNTSMVSNGFHSMGNVPKIDQATLMMENMIKEKKLPQKGKLLQAVMEVGPLLQTLLVPPQLLPIPPVSGGGRFSQMAVGGGGSFLSFDDVNFVNYQGRVVSSCPRASNFGLAEKRQRFH